ncbi:MAG: PadR family transcriptional regulator [Gemmatimonadaceae bacterium]
MARGEATDLLQGTLDLLILRTLTLESMHGWAIAQRIQQLSKEVLQVNQGSLYPALHRLEAREWISAQWGTTDQNRRAKYYELTTSGRRQLGEEMKSWRRFTGAVEHVLGGT